MFLTPKFAASRFRRIERLDVSEIQTKFAFLFSVMNKRQCKHLPLIVCIQECVNYVLSKSSVSKTRLPNRWPFSHLKLAIHNLKFDYASHAIHASTATLCVRLQSILSVYIKYWAGECQLYIKDVGRKRMTIVVPNMIIRREPKEPSCDANWTRLANFAHFLRWS